jgi:tartrate dehydratase alpha subunit/fumarate hydratase class I-like protein
VASEEATESIHDDILALVEFVEITIDDNAPTSESEEYNLFKEYLEKFANALTQEERDAAADSAMVLAINMDIAAV